MWLGVRRVQRIIVCLFSELVFVGLKVDDSKVTMVGCKERGWGFRERLCADIFICGVDLACLEIHQNSFLFQYL